MTNVDTQRPDEQTRFVLVWWQDGSRHETEFSTLESVLSWVQEREGEQAIWAEEIRKHTEVVMDMDALLQSEQEPR